MFRLGLWVFEGNTKVSFSLHLIKDSYYQHDNHWWCEFWSPGQDSVLLGYYTVLFPLSVFYFSLKQATKHSPHSRRELSPISWNSYINYLEFCISGTPFLHLFLCINMDSWIFNTWDKILYIILLVTLFQLWSLGAFSWLMSLCYSLPSFGFYSTSFLALQDAPDLQSDISPRSPGSFYWRMLLEMKLWFLMKDWSLGVPIATVLASKSTQQTEHCLCTNPRMHTYLIIFCISPAKRDLKILW